MSNRESETQQSNGAKGDQSSTAPIIPFQPSSPKPVAPLIPQQSKLARGLSLSFAFGMTAAVSATLGGVLMLMTPLSSAIAPQGNQQITLKDIWRKGFGYRITRPVNILVMGIDRVPGIPAHSPEIFSGRSDTMLLVRVDPDTETASILSIPRDTQVRIPGEGVVKINHANTVGGSALAAQVVSHTLNGIPIDRYVRISTDAFRELVDLLGGVEVFVPYPMHYTDNTQGLKIDLDKGQQVLNGDQAEQFARFRHDGYGDVGRVQRQQLLIRALRDRLTNPAVLPKLPRAVQLLQQYIDTNLTLDEMLALVNFGLDLNQDSFRMVMLPGRFSTADEYVASYWIMDSDGRDQVLHEYFDTDSANFTTEARSVDRLRVAVQNASGKPELGREVAAYLRNQGFSNVYVIQDGSEQEQQTQIIVQRGDLQSAAALESVLGVGQVVPASTGDLDSDLTIRVGTDWEDRLNSP